MVWFFETVHWCEHKDNSIYLPKKNLLIQFFGNFKAKNEKFQNSDDTERHSQEYGSWYELRTTKFKFYSSTISEIGFDVFSSQKY